MIGADLSFLTEFEDKNGQYFENCEVNDGISILKNQEILIIINPNENTMGSVSVSIVEN